MEYIVKRDDELLDEIVYKYYGTSFNNLETVLQANTHLYKQGIYLAVGTKIILPNTEIKPREREKLV